MGLNISPKVGHNYLDGNGNTVEIVSKRHWRGIGFVSYASSGRYYREDGVYILNTGKTFNQPEYNLLFEAPLPETGTESTKEVDALQSRIFKKLEEIPEVAAAIQKRDGALLSAITLNCEMLATLTKL